MVVAAVGFITPAFAVLLPEFSRKAVESSGARASSDVSRMGGKIASLFLGAVIPGVIALALISKPLMVFLFGEPFAAAGPVLQFLAAVLFLRSLEYLFAVGLISLDKNWWVLGPIGGGLIINVMLNLLWIPKWGFMGATYAKLVAEIVVFFLSVGLFQLASHGSLFPKWIIKPILVGALMLVLMYLLRGLGMTPAFLIALAVYLGVFGFSESSTLRQLLGSLVHK